MYIDLIQVYWFDTFRKNVHTLEAKNDNDLVPLYADFTGLV